MTLLIQYSFYSKFILLTANVKVLSSLSFTNIAREKQISLYNSFFFKWITGIMKSGQAGSGEVLFVVDQGDEVGEGGLVLDVKDQGDEFPDGLCLGKKGFYSGGKG